MLAEIFLVFIKNTGKIAALNHYNN